MTADLARLVAARDTDGVVRLLEGMAFKVASAFYAPGMHHEDLQQEARIGIAKAVQDYDGRGGFRAFAFMCARRQVITAVTSARRRRHQVLNEAARLDAPAPGTDDAVLGDVVAAVGACPQHLAETREELAGIVARVADLTTVERLVLARLLSGGHSYEDIADELTRRGVVETATKKTVDNALQRAVRKLRAGADAGRGERRGVLLVDRALHLDERAAVREARRVHPGCEVGLVEKKKVRGGRVVAPQGRATADGSLGRPVWAIEVAA